MCGQSPASSHPWGCRPAGDIARGVKLKTGARVMPMGYSKKWVVDTLLRLGYQQAADDALRVLPDQIDLKELQAFGDRHGISRDTLIDRMGGSP